MRQTGELAAVFPAGEPHRMADPASESVYIDVLNTGAHAVQVRSQTHFFDVHRALKFDRPATIGRRLDRPSGDSVRFQPGEIVRVRLVRIADADGLPYPHGRSADARGAGEVRQRGLRRVK